MRIVRFVGGTGVLLDGDRVRPVGPSDDETVLALARQARIEGPGWLPAATGTEVALDEVQLLAPITRPPSIRDFYAFERHVVTARRSRGLPMDPDWYEAPVFYFTAPAAVIGSGAEIATPPRSSALDFELEVAVVIGSGGRDLRPDDVTDLVAGYCVMNDWSARDLQRVEMLQQLGPAKGKDFATSLGPYLVTPDEIAPDPRQPPALAMSAAVNGRTISTASLDELWWSFAEMVCYASESSTLVPGDVIGSGTAGTGCLLELSAVHGADEYPWLQPGDEVCLTVEGLGALSNRVAASASRPWSADAERQRPSVADVSP